MNIDYYKKCNELIEKYHTDNPYDICLYENIIVKVADLGSLKGMYLYIEDRPCVLINENLPESLQKQICCHELCHHILHSDIARKNAITDTALFDIQGRIEQEANCLCAELLIADDDIIRLLDICDTVDKMSSSLELCIEYVYIKIIQMKNRGYKFNNMEMPNVNFLS